MSKLISTILEDIQAITGEAGEFHLGNFYAECGTIAQANSVADVIQNACNNKPVEVRNLEANIYAFIVA